MKILTGVQSLDRQSSKLVSTQAVAKKGEMAKSWRQAGKQYGIGDRISGRWEVQDICGGEGRSGMGVVYIVNDIVIGSTVAAKTFQPRFASDREIQRQIQTEAELWMQLGEHPNIVAVLWIQAVGTQIFILMEYIEPDERGRNCLSHYLTGRPLGKSLALRWLTDACSGMAHAEQRGLTCHRDLKPENLMITRSSHLKITDFGLARVDFSPALSNVRGQGEDAAKGRFGVTTDGKLVGTPGYIAPEVVLGIEPTLHADIYAFGLIAFQMLSGNPRPPLIGRWKGDFVQFEAETLQIRRTHQIAKLDSPLDPIVGRCLAFDPQERYQDFREVLEDIVALGGVPEKALLEARHCGAADTGVKSLHDFVGSMNSLYSLGRTQEGLECVREAKEHYGDQEDLLNMEGVFLTDLGRFDEALKCFDEVLLLKNDFVVYQCNKGRCLRKMGYFRQAVACYEDAIRCDPRPVQPWVSKGNCLFDLRCYHDAVHAYDQALTFDEKNWEAHWGKAKCFSSLGELAKAHQSIELALQLDPHNLEVGMVRDEILGKMGVERSNIMSRSDELHQNGQYEQGLAHIREARLRLGETEEILNNEGIFLTELGSYREAIDCFDRGLKLNSNWVNLWANKGRALRANGQHEEAVTCYDKAIEIDASQVIPWMNKGNCLCDLGLYERALECYRRAADLAPENAEAQHACGRTLKIIESRRHRNY